MPINLSGSQPVPDEAIREANEQHEAETQAALEQEQSQPKRKRRTKAELIADAVVPGLDDDVEVKDKATGAKITRPWRVAVEMHRDGKIDLLESGSDLKYPFLKYEQQRASSAFQTGGTATGESGGEEAASPAVDTPADTGNDSSGQRLAPEGAELGDEVVIGPDVYTVGHGATPDQHVLVQGPVSVDGHILLPTNRWQRELGGARDGEWQSTPVSKPSIDSPANGNGKAQEVKVETEKLGRTIEAADDDVGVLKWKIGNGILEKIGLPDYSSLQVGPISASRMVIDDGRRTVVELGDGRSGQVPTAVIEAFEEVDNTVEYIARRFRGQLQAFLEATGALKQPVG